MRSTGLKIEAKRTKVGQEGLLECKKIIREDLNGELLSLRF